MTGGNLFSRSVHQEGGHIQRTSNIRYHPAPSTHDAIQVTVDTRSGRYEREIVDTADRAI